MGPGVRLGSARLLGPGKDKYEFLEELGLRGGDVLMKWGTLCLFVLYLGFESSI